MVRELTDLTRIPDGYVLNLYGGPTGRVGNTIHPSDCWHISRMKLPPRKIWGDSVRELKDWLKSQGGELDPQSPTCSHV
jgi:hypothetical protein